MIFQGKHPELLLTRPSPRPPLTLRQDATGPYFIYLYDTGRQSTKDIGAETFTVGAYAGFHARCGAGLGLPALAAAAAKLYAPRSNGRYDYHVYADGETLPACNGTGTSTTLVSFVCGSGAQATLQDSSIDSDQCVTSLTVATPAACGIDILVGSELASTSSESSARPGRRWPTLS